MCKSNLDSVEVFILKTKEEVFFFQIHLGSAQCITLSICLGRCLTDTKSCSVEERGYDCNSFKGLGCVSICLFRDWQSY